MLRRRKRTDETSAAAAAEVEADAEAAVGWDAITAALEQLYPGAVPKHVAPIPGPAFGDGVQGISAYMAAGHWHLVTYGLTELYIKESDNPDRSGWGYELTIRVAPSSPDPPQWAFDLLERVARETRRAGTVFAPGHRLDAQSPIDGDHSPFTVLAFTIDPELGSIETPHGQVDFLQIVGATSDELVEMKATSTQAVLDRIASTNPLLVTGPPR